MKLKSLLLPTESKSLDMAEIPAQKYQHIYLIDEEAEIKKGDWVFDAYHLNTCKKFLKVGVDQSVETANLNNGTNGRYSKIITSTNPSLELPLLSEQSIKLLIDYYNREGKMPESVRILIEEDCGYKEGNCVGKQYLPCKINCPHWGYLKTSEDYWGDNYFQGTVDISIPEEKMYNREEVEKLCRNAMFTGELLGRNPEVKTPLGKGFDEISKNWVKKNL